MAKNQEAATEIAKLRETCCCYEKGYQRGRRDENEACAKLIEDWARQSWPTNTDGEAENIAAAIRKRISDAEPATPPPDPAPPGNTRL